MRKHLALAAKILAGGACIALISCDKPNLKDPKGQYSYAIGVQIAKNLKEQNIALDTASFNAGVKDIMDGKTPQLDDNARMTALRAMSEKMHEKEMAGASENLKKGQEYLEKNKAQPGIQVTKSGLQYKIVTEGTGPKPKASDTVEVNYRGKLIDGKEFDSSYARNQPAQFPVDKVIPGWTEALQLFKVGTKAQLFIPSNLAYGDRGNPSIPPNSVLVFDVELLKIVAPEKGGKAAAPAAKKEKK